jgi:predicted TIM-barrel fold metal-dependent hydrolase
MNTDSSDEDIVDAQLHIWLPQSSQRPWPVEYASTPHGPPAMTPDTLLSEMDAARVQAAVVVPPSFEGDRNDYAFDTAAKYPDRFRVQARYMVGNPAVGPQILQDMEQTVGMRGVRVTLNGAAASWLTDGSLDWFWPFMSEHRVPVSLYPWAATATADTGQLAAVLEVGCRFPDLLLGLDHYAVGQWVDETSIDDAIALLEGLGRRTNISLKTSALPTIIGERAYDPANVIRVLKPLAEWFGPARLFWGSDLTRSPGRYQQELGAFKEAASHFGNDVRTQIMGESIKSWLSWD